MTNRVMDLDQIKTIWNDSAKGNDQVASELQYPDFETLKRKVTRCARKDEFIKRPANFVGGAPTPAATTQAAPAGPAPATTSQVAPAPAAPTPITEVTEEVHIERVSVGAKFSTIGENNQIVQRNVVLNGDATDDFAAHLQSLANKYSLGEGNWLNSMNNQPVQTFTNGIVVVFRPLVRAGSRI